jgi:hypothetical protein
MRITIWALSISLERHHFGGAQAATVGEAQQQAVLEAGCGTEQASHFLGAKHQRDLLRLGNVLDPIGDLRAPQRHPKQEGDPGHRAVAGADAHTLLGQMQLEETDILSCCRIGRAAKERRQLPAATDVGFLGARGEVAQAHVLDHALAQRAEGRGTHRELLS